MTTTMNTTENERNTEFGDSFRKLLEASNLVQRLREMNARPGDRIEAQTKLMRARVDAGRARSMLN